MELFFRPLRRLILILAYGAGAAVLLMMGVTVADVVLRIFGIGITGAYDLVRALGAVAVAFGLPYLTAVKGHIAIEFFYHKCGRRGRVVLDTVFRLVSLTIFAVLAVHTFRYGLGMMKTGEVFPTLGLPLFWIPLLISFSSILMIIVFVYHLLHPGKEYIKP
jgi:TRAP-type C4-dicarboxylate transport system permease small subunit